jgi:hypothetical protein
MESSKIKHIFNTFFFAVLAIPTMFYAINGSIKLINNHLNPVDLGPHVIQSSVSPIILVITLFIHLILPIIFSIVLIFHILAHYKCNLNSKFFETEFKINRVLVIAGIIGVLLVVGDYLFGEGYIGMLLGLPAIAWVIALFVSIVFFFKGFSNSKLS